MEAGTKLKNVGPESTQARGRNLPYPPRRGGFLGEAPDTGAEGVNPVEELVFTDPKIIMVMR